MPIDPTLDGVGDSSTRADSVGGDGSSGKVDHSTYERTIGEVKSLKQRLSDTSRNSKNSRTKNVGQKNKRRLRKRIFSRSLISCGLKKRLLQLKMNCTKETRLTSGK